MNDSQFVAKAIMLHAQKNSTSLPFEVACLVVLAMVADGYLVMTREGHEMLVTKGAELPLELATVENKLPC